MMPVIRNCLAGKEPLLLVKKIGCTLFLVLAFFANASAQETRKVRLAYSAFSISFLNLFLARDAGLFKKHGLEPELIQMAGPLPIAALAAGEID